MARSPGGASRNGPDIRLGLRANLGQFALLVAVNGLVGGMVGQERTLLPLLATDVFGLVAVGSALTFIVAFGLTKAIANFAAGALADRYGRKPVLVAGWLLGLPVPLLLIWAPDWGWIVLANVLLGVNQGLTLVDDGDHEDRPRRTGTRRGLALGLNEAAGYGAVAVTALATGFIAERWGLRPAPFLLGVAYAGLGLGLSVLFVRETRDFARLEAADDETRRWPSGGACRHRRVFAQTSLRERALSAASQAGLVNNLNDGLAWGLLPLFYAAAGLSLGEIGLLAATYPAVWGVGQLATGGLSDRIGRKRLIVGGMLLQAAALAVIAASQ